MKEKIIGIMILGFLAVWVGAVSAEPPGGALRKEEASQFKRSESKKTTQKQVLNIPLVFCKPMPFFPR